MLSTESDQVLRRMVAEAGVDADAPSADDVWRTWEAWKRFAATPTEDVDHDPWANDDGMLVQYGVYSTFEPPGFELDFTRQFSYYDDAGEYSHMAQLACTFGFEATTALREIPKGNLWSFDMELTAFFDAAERMPGLVRVRELRPAPLSLSIRLGAV